jgi:hypothetical protein
MLPSPSLPLAIGLTAISLCKPAATTTECQQLVCCVELVKTMKLVPYILSPWGSPCTVTASWCPSYSLSRATTSASSWMTREGGGRQEGANPLRACRANKHSKTSVIQPGR